MSRPDGTARVVILVENIPLAQDHRLRKQVKSLVSAGHDVTVICRRHPGNRQVPGVRVLEYPAPPDASSRLGYVREYGVSALVALALLLKVLSHRGLDVLQVCGAPDIYFPLAAALRLLGKRVVYDQRDPSPETYAARYGQSNGALARALLWCERQTYRAADHVVTVNGTLRDVATSRGGVPPYRVSVVGNGPNLADLPAPDATAEGDRTGAAGLYVGFMGPQDRIDLALRAIHHLVHERGRHDVRFRFVGEGEERPALQELAHRLDLDEHVTFLGWQPYAVVFAEMSRARIGLESNLEPFVSPVKVMEYMGCGLPVVAFDLRETRELAGDAAAYAPPGDVVAFAQRLEELWDDPRARRRLGAAGRERVEHSLAWEHQEPAYLDVFARLAPHRNRSRPSLLAPSSSRQESS